MVVKVLALLYEGAFVLPVLRALVSTQIFQTADWGTGWCQKKAVRKQRGQGKVSQLVSLNWITFPINWDKTWLLILLWPHPGCRQRQISSPVCPWMISTPSVPWGWGASVEWSWWVDFRRDGALKPRLLTGFTCVAFRCSWRTRPIGRSPSKCWRSATSWTPASRVTSCRSATSWWRLTARSSSGQAGLTGGGGQ